MISHLFEAMVQVETHLHPIGAGFFIRRSLVTADAMQTEQVFDQAEVHPTPRAGGRVEAVANFRAFHQALAGAARSTDCHHSLALTGGESQNFLHAAMTQGSETQV